jgi:ABC-type sugar transport system substrate-binding protein
MKTRITCIVWLLLLAHEARAADLRIGIVCIVGRLGSTEQQMVRAGALAAAKEQSSQGETHVTVDWQVASEPSEESAAIRVMAERKVDGIVLLGYDEESLHIAIIVQHVNGIPVVICGGSGPQSGVSAVVGTDNRLCGRRLMEALANELSNQGLIAIFGGDFPGNPFFGPRVQGAQDRAKDFPDIRIATVTYAEPDQVTYRMLDVSTARPGLNGWLMVVNWGLPVTPNSQNQPPQKVVTVDPGIETGVKQLEAGQLQALLVQDFYGWGRQSVLLLSDKTRRPQEPTKNFVPTDVTVVTHENLHNFLGKLKEQLGDK